MFHYTFKAEFVALASLKVPSGSSCCKVQLHGERKKYDPVLGAPTKLFRRSPKKKKKTFDVRDAKS